MSYLQTIHLETARILRDNPHLREVGKRIEVWELVKEKFPYARPSTVNRSCRKLQNGMGKYRDSEEDEELRSDLAEEHKKFFRTGV